MIFSSVLKSKKTVSRVSEKSVLQLLQWNIRDPGKCPYFSKEIVHTDQHDLTLNFIKAMKNDEHVSIFKKMEFVMHTKL